MSAPEEETRFVDLHLHTNYSDGSDTPTRVVERAAELGFAAIAITDHDTLSGVPEAIARGRELGVEVLPGTEISTECGGRETHILGLGVALDCPALLAELATLVEGRGARAERIVEKLNAAGVPVDLERVRARTGDGSIGRMHIAQEVLELGRSRTVQDAFDKFLKSGRPAWVPKPLVSSRRAIDLIHEAGGFAFAAHPGVGNDRRRISELLQQPFDGVEVYHSKHTPGQTTEFMEIARERGWLITGGSDCHGTIKGERTEMGRVKVPYELFARLKDALETTG